MGWEEAISQEQKIIGQKILLIKAIAAGWHIPDSADGPLTLDELTHEAVRWVDRWGQET